MTATMHRFSVFVGPAGKSRTRETNTKDQKALFQLPEQKGDYIGHVLDLLIERQPPGMP